LAQVMVSKSSVMNILEGVLEWVHVRGVLINGGLQWFDLDWLVCGF
jgi:hypothetical protein